LHEVPLNEADDGGRELSRFGAAGVVLRNLSYFPSADSLLP
jgi:hypothetical protein